MGQTAGWLVLGAWGIALGCVGPDVNDTRGSRDSGDPATTPSNPPTTRGTWPVDQVRMEPTFHLFREIGASVMWGAVPLDRDRYPQEGREITWRVEDPGVATVAADGRVWAGGAGETEVVAEIEGVEARAGVRVDLWDDTGVGRHRMCGLKTGGRAYCRSRTGRVLRVPHDQPVEKISVAGGHACLLDAMGDAWCWGEGSLGQLGHGGTDDVEDPVRVAGGHAFIGIAASSGGVGTFAHTCGLTVGGEVWCWGHGGGGQLGVDEADLPTCDHGGEDRPCSPEPVRVQVPTDATGGATDAIVVAIDARAGVTVALTDDGLAHEWGASGVTSSPVRPVEGVSALITITRGERFTCGTDALGEATCWGATAGSRLGRGEDPSPAPGAVLGGHVFAQVDAGRAHACGITEEGEALCWGENAQGELGLGTFGDPEPAPGATVTELRFARIVAGDGATCAVTRDGRLFCWGAFNSGASSWFATPTRVPDPPV